MIGYDNIPVRSLDLKLNKDLSTPQHSNEYSLKAFLVNHGFIETINSPFSSINSSDCIEIDNPLDRNRKNIRTNLTDSLIENLIYNEKRQKDSIKLFEISDIYTLKNGIQKSKRFAAVISGRQGQNYLEFSKKLNDEYLIDIFKKIDVDISNNILNVDRSKLKTKIKTPIFAIELNLEDLPVNIPDISAKKTSFSDVVKYKPISEFPSRL